MSKVLVLGAGASLAYNFPLGGTLRTQILSISEQVAIRAGIVADSFYRSDTEKLGQFQVAFRNSQMYSIDAFLARRPEFSEIGKKCIATILLQLESQGSLFSEDGSKDHWYQYLFNFLTNNDWEGLNFDDLAVVTFNYDRSLEHFLFYALQSAYNKTAAEVSVKMQSLRIEHVYGSLSPILPGLAGYLPYDGGYDERKVEKAAEGLIVIPEGRIDSPSLQRSRQWLSDASDIAFLGFGFDPTNVERLAAGGACRVSVQRDGGSHHVRTLCGTRIGMYDAELDRAYLAMIEDRTFRDGVRNFHEKNCTQMLRITQFLR